jgi:hypothetical protein
MRRWLQRVIHRWLGPTRYHDQASAVTARSLRAELLARRLQVIQRRHR